MTLTIECPHCHLPQRLDYNPAESSLRCHECSREIALRTEAMAQNVVQSCPVCGTKDMYIQKDFPHRLGLSIVGVGTLLSTLAWWRYYYLLALGILLLTAFLDLCLYYLIGDVLVCYRCLAQIRGSHRNLCHEPFDLGVGERYRQERMRLHQLRQAATPTPPNSSGS